MKKSNLLRISFCLIQFFWLVPNDAGMRGCTFLWQLLSAYSEVNIKRISLNYNAPVQSLIPNVTTRSFILRFHNRSILESFYSYQKSIENLLHNRFQDFLVNFHIEYIYLLRLLMQIV